MKQKSIFFKYFVCLKNKNKIGIFKKSMKYNKKKSSTSSSKMKKEITSASKQANKIKQNWEGNVQIEDVWFSIGDNEMNKQMMISMVKLI